MYRWIIAAFVVGAVIGGGAGMIWKPEALSLTAATRSPLPHQVARFPGGISLRFAMVHDVIHERFPLHGKDYYEHRNQVVTRQIREIEQRRAATQAVASTSPAAEFEDRYWRLLDDLAVGLVHTGEFDRAAALMRDKLNQQRSRALPEASLYSSYANLGTAMMIGALHKLDAPEGPVRNAAIEELRESLRWVRKSIEANPQAHFGREIWQVVLGEYLLAATVSPELLNRYDMIGNRLDEAEAMDSSRGQRRIHAWNFRTTREAVGDPQLSDQRRAMVRDWIPKVGAEGQWHQEVLTSHGEAVPFDEPVLGIVGIWRYGAGANIHFSLALAETMFRVDQHYIAWSAYERTARLADGRQPALVEHCRRRQRQVEENIPPEQRSRLRPSFEAELKRGLEYQAAYQAYEKERIGRGTSIDDPHFYDAFFTAHGEIASDPGDADEAWYGRRPSLTSFIVPPGLLGGGSLALLAALWSGRKCH